MFYDYFFAFLYVIADHSNVLNCNVVLISIIYVVIIIT